MRRTDKQIESREEMEEILRQGEVVTLCLMDGDEPYMVPLNYGYADGKLYFHSAKAGRKVGLMARSAKVRGLVVSQAAIVNENGENGDQMACALTSRYKSVMFEGKLELLSDAETCRKAMLILLEHYGHRQAILPENSLDAVNLYCLTIIEMTGKRSPTK